MKILANIVSSYTIVKIILLNKLEEIEIDVAKLIYSFTTCIEISRICNYIQRIISLDFLHAPMYFWTNILQCDIMDDMMQRSDKKVSGYFVIVMHPFKSDLSKELL